MSAATNALPLLRTKLSIPGSTTDIVFRERLTSLLYQSFELPMRLVSVKTTRILFKSLLSLSIIALSTSKAFANEGGTSFWLPGQYGSLVAVPGDPGWSLPVIYYHSTVDAGGSREFPSDGRITLGLDVGIDLLLAVPTYVFSEPVWGGQASIAVAGVYGRVDVSVDATLTAPGGGEIAGSERDSLVSAGDLFPSFTVKWNNGVHNTMVYTMLGVPVGS